jgi:S-adenosylmethionine:tRNA ribosyltransferase-isomerase
MFPPAFELPAEREARRPPELRGIPRDGVSMLISDVRSGEHVLGRFADIAKYLRAGDLLVVNDSATIPAALSARRPNGSGISLHLSTRLSETLWIVEPRRAPLIAIGEVLELPADGRVVMLRPVARANARLWYARFSLPASMAPYLHAYGRPIAYGYADDAFPLEFYQTIFAREPGSVEMPSAGRPFTLRAIDALYQNSVSIVPVTLHCGVASPETHEPPMDERFSVPPWTALAVNTTRRSGGRVIAVGTSAVRALESACDENGIVRPMNGWTSHIVDPLHPPRTVDGLLTGFHEPRASHLNMLQGFASSAFLREAYTKAMNDGLLWHEFGDVHLLMRSS